MKKKLMIIATLFSPLLFGCHDKIDRSVITTLEIDRYMGRWYEIARLDNRFERGLVGVTAEYTLLGSGKIGVLNSGYRDSLNGEWVSADGIAKQIDRGRAGALKVAFFWKFYTPYNILVLDQERYRYALVGGHNDKYLWILSRTPQLEPEITDRLIAEAAKRGYDTNQLIFVEQENQEE